MTYQDMMHGKDYGAQKLRGWLACEKFDGCRGYWDGQRMWSKEGNEITLPAEWRAALPAIPLDGEIYAGRGRFFTARNAVVFNKWDDEGLCYRVFDAPQASGTWVQRLDAASSALIRCGAFASVVEPVVITSERHAWELLQSALDEGAEGLMVRHPANMYRPGRTSQLLKLKKLPGAAWKWRAKQIDRLVGV